MEWFICTQEAGAGGAVDLLARHSTMSKYNITNETGEMSEVYKNACEGVQELSEHPSEAFIAFFTARSKSEFCFLFGREGNSFRSEKLVM